MVKVTVLLVLNQLYIYIYISNKSNLCKYLINSRSLICLNYILDELKKIYFYGNNFTKSLDKASTKSWNFDFDNRYNTSIRNVI